MTCLEQSFFNLLPNRLKDIADAIKASHSPIICYEDLNGCEHVEAFRNLKISTDGGAFYVNSDPVTIGTYNRIKKQVVHND